MVWQFIAPMRCRVLSLEVSNGQPVEEGQVLAVFEDCRGLLMQTIIKSPRRGVFHIADISVEDAIEAGTPVFSVE